MTTPHSAQIDHLVVAARTLDEGVAWCEATLGVVPGPGGEHALFGTHNRLVRLHCEHAPRAYLEIIAVNPQATPTRPAPLKRWFDLDDPALRARLAQHGPQLVHWVASVPDIDAALLALQAIGIQRGPVVSASRETPNGLLQWRISVRDDGQRLFNGALPSLIQWGKPGEAEPLRLHPRNSLPRSGVTLQSIAITHPSGAKLQAAYEAIGLADVGIETGPANITATLKTPKGLVQLQSLGL